MLASQFEIEAHWIIIQLVLLISLEIFVLKLIMRMPGLDVFRIRDEYMYLLAMGLILIISIVCLLVYYEPNDNLKITTTRLIYHFMVMSASVAAIAISIIYPYRVNIAIRKDLSNLHTFGRQSSMTRSRKNSATASKSARPKSKHVRRLKSESSNHHHASRKKRTNSASKSFKTNTNISSPNLSPRFSPKTSPKSSPKLSPQLSPPLSPQLSPPNKQMCPSPINTVTDFQLNGTTSSSNIQSRDRPKSIIEMIGMGSTPVTVSSPTAPNRAPSLSRQPSPISRDIDRNDRGQPSTPYNRVSLEQVMSELVGIEAFLRHVVKELSAENLFFLSDVVQYKMSFITDGILQDIPGWFMELPQDIPKSYILKEKDHYERGRMICNKYIRQNSEREINISWSARCNIVSKFDSNDLITAPEPYECSQRFDAAATEIRKLLADSFRRFCLTPVKCISVSLSCTESYN